MTLFQKKNILPPLLGLLLIIVGCAEQRPPLKSLDEAHEKFIQYCQEDNIDVVLKPLENTLWIYLPLNEELVRLKATGYGITTSASTKFKPTLNLIEVDKKDDNFQINYDVDLKNSYPKHPGYGSGYSPKFNTTYRTIYSNISRTYINIEDNEYNNADIPDFLVIIFADIQNGIEIRTLMTLIDFKKEISHAVAMDESPMRRITEVSGNKNAIGDKTGEYLDLYDVTWEEFISKQIENRVSMAYNTSSHPPSEKTQELILEQTARTLKIYEYDDYSAVYLNNFNTDKQEIIDKSYLDDFDITALEPKGKIHTIKFDRFGKIDSITEGDNKPPAEETFEEEPTIP